MERKLGLEPAFASEYHNGISKRLYVAKGYADCAYKWADEICIENSLEIMGMDANTKWNHPIHFPMLVVKLQYMLADEFLKQENNG